MRPVVLVTGINGLIGWSLFNLLKTQKVNVIGTYRKWHERFDPQRCFKTDLTNPKEIKTLLNEVNPTHILHARSMCDLDVCELAPELAYRINVTGTQYFCEASQRLTRLQRFVYFSTDHVFSGEKGNYTESDLPEPKHVYGRTKLEAEKIVIQSAVPYLIIRPGLLIGQSVQGNKGPHDFLISRLKAGKQTHLFTDEWRTPIDLEEFAKQAMDLIARAEQGIYHIAGQTRINRYDLGVQIAKENGLPTALVMSRKRHEDQWAQIRPKDLSLVSTE